MTCDQCEPTTLQVRLKPSDTPVESENFLLDFFSVCVSERDAYATGLSLPSGIRYDKTAPRPYDELSHGTTMGKSELK